MSTIKLLTYPAYDILSIFHKTYLALTHDADDLKSLYFRVIATAITYFRRVYTRYDE